MKEIYAETRIRRRDIAEGRYMGTSLRDSAIRDLVRGLVEELQRQAAIEYREEMDPETGDLVVRAGLYVAEGGERIRGGNNGPKATFEVPRFSSSFMTEMMLEPPPESKKAKEGRDRLYLELNELINRERIENQIAPPKLRPDVEGSAYFFGGRLTMTNEPAPSTLTEAKMKEAVESMKKMLDSEMGKTVFPPFLLNPLTFMDTRMERKKAQQDGEVAALLKARGEKQVRENTKKRGVELKIEVGVRKITMPEEKKETG